MLTTDSYSVLLFLSGPIIPIITVSLLKHVLAWNFGFQFGAYEKGAAHFPVERVSLFWGRDQPVLQHDWDEAVDLLSCALQAKVKRFTGCKSFPQDEHSIQVGIFHGLRERKPRRVRSAGLSGKRK